MSCVRAYVLEGHVRVIRGGGNTSRTGSRRCSLASSRGWQRCGPGDNHCTYAMAVQRLTSRWARAHSAAATTTTMTIPAQPVVCRDAPLRLPPTDVTTPLQRTLLVQSLFTTISAVLCVPCVLSSRRFIFRSYVSRIRGHIFFLFWFLYYIIYFFFFRYIHGLFPSNYFSRKSIEPN